MPRRALLGLALGGGVTLLGVRGWPGADIRSQVSEISQLRLPDGGEMLLDSDSALRALADALPVRIQHYTRWWTLVRPHCRFFNLVRDRE